jgi:AhpD family alkylhydroperoxidase
MEARMKNPVFVLPEAMQALQALGKATSKGLPESTIQLVHLRASQINGCGVCVDMHARDLRRQGESDVRLFAVAAWRDTPFFTEAAKHYDERQLALLVMNIAQINLWNRINVTVKEVALGRPWTAEDLKAAG